MSSPVNEVFKELGYHCSANFWMKWSYDDKTIGFRFIPDSGLYFYIPFWKDDEVDGNLYEEIVEDFDFSIDFLTKISRYIRLGMKRGYTWDFTQFLFVFIIPNMDVVRQKSEKFFEEIGQDRIKLSLVASDNLFRFIYGVIHDEDFLANFMGVRVLDNGTILAPSNRL
jgi:hypothetical protein